MAIAHDASSTATPGTGNLSWTHTPVGTPRGVLVLIVQDVGATNEVTAVTYGGFKMTAVSGAPVLHTAGSEDGAIYAYFLGSSVPAGAQTVAVTVDATGSVKSAACATMTAAKDCTALAAGTLDGASVTNPTLNVTTGTGVGTSVYGALHTGTGAITNVAPGAGYADIFEHDFGAACASFIRRSTNGTGGVISVDWTAPINPAGAIGVAIREGVDIYAAYGFEESGLTGFTIVGTGSEVTSSASDPITGDRSLLCQNSAGEGNAHLQVRRFINGAISDLALSDLTVHFRLRVPSGHAVVNTLLVFHDDPANSQSGVLVLDNGVLKLYDLGGTNLLYTGSALSVADHWIALRVLSGAGTGTADLHVDGAQVFVTAAAQARVGPHRFIRLGHLTDSPGANTGVSLKFDDLVLASGFIDDLDVRVFRLTVDGTGSAEAPWPAAAGTEHLSVDDETSDGAATVVTTPTEVNGHLTVTLTGLPSGWTVSSVLAVSAGVVAARNGGTNASIKARLEQSGSTGLESTAVTTTATFQLIGLVTQTDPVSGIGFTTGDIATLEVGVTDNDATNASDWTACIVEMVTQATEDDSVGGFPMGAILVGLFLDE